MLLKNTIINYYDFFILYYYYHVNPIFKREHASKAIEKREV